MSLPTPQLSGSDNAEKVVIPRLATQNASKKDRADKPRAPRACNNCRNLKVKCTGELTLPSRQCIRHIPENNARNVYPSNSRVFTLKEDRTDSRRQYYHGACPADHIVFRFSQYIVLRDLLGGDIIEDRSRAMLTPHSMTEQNMHMVALMKHLKERVGGDDKQQISDLLASFDQTTPSTAPTSKSQRLNIGASESSDTEYNTTTGIYAKTQPSQHEDSSATDYANKPPHYQWLQGLQFDKTQIQGNETASTLGTSPPSTIWSAPESTSTKRGSDHFQVDSALLEMFWYLQSKNGDEAQELLRHIRRSGPISITSTHKWLKDQHSSIALSDSNSSIALHKPSVSKIAKLEDETPKEQWKTIVGINKSAIYDTPEAERCGPFVTVATVKAAVEMFFNATGLLFYVFPKEQADSIQHDLLNEDKYPGDTPFAVILGKSKNIQEKARLAEICGAAAVGMLYQRLFDKQQPPPIGLSDYFYSTTKHMLDSTIEANPLRAMKVCAMLAMYNIVVKGAVALAYVELGLGLADTHGLNKPVISSMGKEVLIDHKRTWRTLLTFSGWLGASTGYVSERASPSLLLLEEIEDAEDEDIVQRELVKVTIIKSRIIQAIPKDGAMSDFVIDSFRQELNAITKGLANWMTLGALLTSKKPTPMRRIIMYFHLFFLSAMMLLHRRAMAIPADPPTTRTTNVTVGVREGLMAAKLAARMLALMRQEGTIVQLCWLCIYSSYTAGIIVLQAAIQKIIAHHDDLTWIADLSLVHACVDVLKYCAEIDPVASKLEATLSTYLNALQRIKGFKPNSNLGENTEEGENIDYLFDVPKGFTTLEMAARDLQRLLQYPFGTFLELIPGGGPKAPDSQATLVSWMEAAVGAPQEWTWELQNCGQQANKMRTENVRSACQMGDVMANISPGRYLPMGEESPWSTWTTPKFM